MGRGLVLCDSVTKTMARQQGVGEGQRSGHPIIFTRKHEMIEFD